MPDIQTIFVNLASAIPIAFAVYRGMVEASRNIQKRVVKETVNYMDDIIWESIENQNEIIKEHHKEILDNQEYISRYIYLIKNEVKGG